MKPLILVTNDDGIEAPGIHALARSMTALGDVHIVAPLTEQSAVGHAITVRDPVRVKPWPFESDGLRIQAHAVTGTPADCVKLAMHHLLGRRPDLVVSGINRGPNTAVNVIYSGTVSAATEAAILGIDSIAFSLCAWEPESYEEAGGVAQTIARRVLSEGLPPGVLLNVNIPPVVQDGPDAYRVTRQARAHWQESFLERMDPQNQPYFWMTGKFVNQDEGEDTDVEAVDAGHVSITPIRYDLTAHDLIARFGEWAWDER